MIHEIKWVPNDEMRDCLIKIKYVFNKYSNKIWYKDNNFLRQIQFSKSISNSFRTD